MTNQTVPSWGLDGDDLPEIITLRSGAKWDPRENHWNFVDGFRAIYIDFNSLPAQVAPLISQLKRVLINVLEENSSIYASNLFYNFVRLAEVVAEACSEVVHEIQVSHIINYISKYSIGDKLGMESQLSALITRWDKLSLKGFSDAAVEIIKSRRKTGNVKGEAVRMLDPINGPLSDYELQEFTAALTNAYADGQIDEQLYQLAWLAVLTGQRVSQYCALKVRDVFQKRVQDGGLQYEIQIPTAKRRNELSRSSFLLRPLPYQFGESLWNYAEKIRSSFGEDGPLFPSDNRRIERMQLNSEFKHHWEVVTLGAHFRDQLARIAPISPRTFEPMHLVIGRFRDTIGTRAAQEGYGELVIAEILGHLDTQNVGAYIAVIPDIAPRLDKALVRDLAPIANAFLGRVLRSPKDATRAEDPASQIVDYKHAKTGVGSCGTTYDCQFNAPIACYTCRNFEAWIDAPHERLLDHLLSERARLLRTSGPRIASVNDRTIVAIQAVLDECARIREMGGDVND